MKNLYRITFIALLALSFARCGTLDTLSLAGHAAGGDVKLKSIAYDYETDLASKSELMSSCAVVGTQLGYTVETQTPELIEWKVAQSNKLQEYFGKYSTTQLIATVIWNEDKAKQTLRISSYISGNYSEANKAKVDTLITGFENRLRDNLEQNRHTLTKLE